MDGAALITHAGPAEPPAPAGQNAADYVCACGHPLRVFGGGRHRVYFERDNLALDSPVMNGVCPVCGRGLPGKQ
jgi:hypothetical protein